MANLVERNAEFHDATVMAAQIRECDYEELLAMSGPDVESTLRQAVRMPGEHYVCHADGDLLALYGVVETQIPGVGIPWMVGTDHLDRYPLALIKRARKHVAAWRAKYSLLINYVDARNTPSLVFLRALGFEINRAVPCGARGLPFHQFILRS